MYNIQIEPLCFSSSKGKQCKYCCCIVFVYFLKCCEYLNMWPFISSQISSRMRHNGHVNELYICVLIHPHAAVPAGSHTMAGLEQRASHSWPAPPFPPDLLVQVLSAETPFQLWCFPIPWSSSIFPRVFYKESLALPLLLFHSTD